MDKSENIHISLKIIYIRSTRLNCEKIMTMIDANDIRENDNSETFKENQSSTHKDDEKEKPADDIISLTNPEEDIAKFKDLWMRTAAELENMRKRSAKERDDTLKYAVTKFAQDMVAVADNLSRALEIGSVSIPDDMKGMIEGIKLVQEELRRIFERHGIQEIHPLGQLFDPNFHQAMFEIPATENLTAGTVGQVLQVGYIIHDRLLRPAMVGVVK